MIKLSKGRYVLCPGKEVNFPTSENLPLAWLKASENGGEVSFFEVDGFIIDFKKSVCSALFLKLEYSFDAINEISGKALIDAFRNDKNLTELGHCSELAKSLEVPLFLAMWPVDYPKSRPKLNLPPVWIFNLLTNEIVMNGFGVDLGIFLSDYRKIQFQNPKSLNVARSFMECALSLTPNPWPGDIDCIAINNFDHKIQAIIEFKTHNLNSPISTESSNKYALQDLRRFRVLNYLQSQLSTVQNFSPTLLFVVWGKNHQKIKVQQILDGKVYREELLDSPLYESSVERFLKEISEMFIF